MWGWKFHFILILCLLGILGAPSIEAGSMMLNIEKTVGNSSYQQIIAEKKVVQLPETQAARLEGIFRRLVNQSKRKSEVEYKLFVVQDESVNAFALPAGYIFIHTGLLSFSASDGELAGVMGHEIGHVELKHSMHALEQSVGLSVLTQLVSGKDDSNRKKLLIKMGSVGAGLVMRGYGRHNEYNADRYGVQLMRAAGFKKDDILNFWRRMEKQNKESNSIFVRMLSTHPPTSERIKRIESM